MIQHISLRRTCSRVVPYPRVRPAITSCRWEFRRRGHREVVWATSSRDSPGLTTAAILEGCGSSMSASCVACISDRCEISNDERGYTSSSAKPSPLVHHHRRRPALKEARIEGDAVAIVARNAVSPLACLAIPDRLLLSPCGGPFPVARGFS